MTGDPEIDKKRERLRLSMRRGKLNKKRVAEGLSKLKGKYTKEEIDFFGNIRYF